VLFAFLHQTLHITELHLSKTLIDRSQYKAEAIEESFGKGNKLSKLCALKKVNERLGSVVTRGKSVKLALAMIMVVLLSAILSGLIIANVRSLYQTSSTISSIGTFKAIGIGVYWDDDSTSRVKEIDWGFLAPGSQKSFTVYVCNEGNIALTLSISASNWNPSIASNYLTLTWSYTGQTVKAGATIPVTLTLRVSESVTGVSGFNFDITSVGKA
jgi:hypothetical protein